MIVKSKKTERKKPIGKSRTEQPAIFVKIETLAYGFRHKTYAKATIWNRRGAQYLRWRDGETVRNFYLGKKKK